MLEVVDLDITKYDECLAIQQEYVKNRSDGKIGDVLLLTEHFECFTMGRKRNFNNIKVARSQIKGIDVFEVNRGGDVTFHGPGQLMLYPILNLKDRELGLHRYLWLLEECGIQFLKTQGIQACRRKAYTGVWVDDIKTKDKKLNSLRQINKSTSSCGLTAGSRLEYETIHSNFFLDPAVKPQDDANVSQTAKTNDKKAKIDKPSSIKNKITSIGIGVRKWVSFHGMAFNINTDLKYFSLIWPCGIKDAQMTSLEKLKAKKQDMSEVKKVFIEIFKKAF